MKNYKVAIISPNIGAPSETFIMRHISDLAPGNTVAIFNRVHPLCNITSWDFPVYDLSNHWNCLHNKIIRYIFRKTGFWKPHHHFLPAKNFLREHRVKVILGEYLNFTHPWIKIAKELNIPIFAHAHGYDVSQIVYNQELRDKYKDYNATQGIITMSEASRSRLLKIGILPEKVHVVNYGVHVPPSPLLIHRKKNGGIKCLAVGRMIAKKAPLKLLDSFCRATENNSRLVLDYVGDGDLLPEVKKYIQKWELEDKVTLHGVQSNQTVLKLMRKADIFIQHSITDPDTGDEEGLPVAILEAMASSLPVVSTDHAGIPEAVINGETGFIVDEGDIMGMSDAISKLASDTDLRIKMGLAGWRRAKGNYTWEKERESLLNLIKQI